ncbi:MAG TPA: hypothetical protein EYH55_00980 [Methanothermococcus okinawensis]|uniref:Uncharacterized protein n=1 Tax=Methanothermococcus okinawensis TaxID=155863 RepID=A0A833A634_9EURY|nr:hypothetical protein [Methanothermococcus okinawensis]
MIEIISYQEVKGRDKEIAKKEFEKLLEKIKREYRCEVLSVEEDWEEKEGFHTFVAELRVYFDTFLDYIKYSINYAADVDVLEPPKLTLDPEEFGEALVYIVDFFERFYKTYDVAFSMQTQDKIEIDIEKYKEGIYDEEDIYNFEEEGLIRVKAVFEGYGLSEEEVVKRMLFSLKDNIIVNKVITKELEREEPYKDVGFYGLIGVEMLCRPIDVIEIAYKFIPVVISIESKKIEISCLELQDIGNELGGAIFELSHAAVMRGIQ